MKTAIIDLGTNTFQLLIIEKMPSGEVNTILKKSIPSKIGKGGINQNIITSEAIERAVNVLGEFRKEIDNQVVVPNNIHAIGTSAIRNAENKDEFCREILEKTGITITVIQGDEEAELIYLGVKEAVKISSEPSMIIDIGGGSVEFIICNAEKVLWKQSFEIGGQRLMEKFMKTDPISMRAIQQLDDYFREQLLPLANACHQYSPQIMVGSSGSFDTLVDMYFMKKYNRLPDSTQTEFDLPLAEFYHSYEELITRNREERMELKGMIELRVEMIVVAVCLIRYLIQTFDIQQITVSRYSLKEGVMSKILVNG
jgi:exopolyphosphatase/guanosine-5'-triphosphate,3'-diphosphate pyrophosphatase